MRSAGLSAFNSPLVANWAWYCRPSGTESFSNHSFTDGWEQPSARAMAACEPKYARRAEGVMVRHFRNTDDKSNRFTENLPRDDCNVPKKLEPAPLSTFGGRLAHWRKLRGFSSQGEFAEQLGIRQGSLSELESGKSKSPSAEVLVRACEVLQIRPRYLWLGEEPAELLSFSDLSGPEAQLVMMFRGLASDAARQALLIDLDARQKARVSPSAPQKELATGGSSSDSPNHRGTGTDGR